MCYDFDIKVTRETLKVAVIVPIRNRDMAGG